MPKFGISDSPKVVPMMTQAALVWPDDSRMDFPSLEAAEYAALLLSMGWREPIDCPIQRKEASRLYGELESYVRECERQFLRKIEETAENAAQGKRLLQLFLSALGRQMFETAVPAS